MKGVCPMPIQHIVSFRVIADKKKLSSWIQRKKRSREMDTRLNKLNLSLEGSALPLSQADKEQ